MGRWDGLREPARAWHPPFHLGMPSRSGFEAEPRVYLHSAKADSLRLILLDQAIPVASIVHLETDRPNIVRRTEYVRRTRPKLDNIEA